MKGLHFSICFKGNSRFPVLRSLTLCLHLVCIQLRPLLLCSTTQKDMEINLAYKSKNYALQQLLLTVGYSKQHSSMPSTSCQTTKIHSVKEFVLTNTCKFISCILQIFLSRVKGECGPHTPKKVLLSQCQARDTY